MAAAFLRNGMAKNLKTLVPLIRSERGIKTTSGTVPKMKAYAAAAEGEPSKGKSKGGNYVPLYVALGMIALSVGLGLHTAKQQFMHAPAVRVKKSNRAMVSEVDEPERVADESNDFIKKSFFRKVANVQEQDNPVDDPIHGNTLVRDGRLESLKSVGIGPGVSDD